jgi:hypothetical protein
VRGHLHSHQRGGCHFVERARCRRGERDCSRLETAAHPSLRSGPHFVRPTLLRKVVEPMLFLSSRVRIPPGQLRAGNDALRRGTRGEVWRRERDCSGRGTALHPSLTRGTALRASNFAPQSCRTQLVSSSRVRIPLGAPRADNDALRRETRGEVWRERGIHIDSRVACFQAISKLFRISIPLEIPCRKISIAHSTTTLLSRQSTIGHGIHRPLQAR